MAIVTKHEVSGNDIFNRLVKDGVIHEGDIFSTKKNEYVHFDNLFDYSKCDEKTLSELQSRTGRKDMLVPVQKSDNGGMRWFLDYTYDDLPSVAIGRLYPDDIFEYYQTYDGHLDVSCYFKGEHNVTPDGKPYDDVIYKISDKLIKERQDGSMVVKLFLDPSDQCPAMMYCDKADIIPCDFRGEHAWEKGYSSVVVRDEMKKIPVYRILEDGTKTKENWSVGDINDAMEKTKEEYKETLQRAEANVNVEDHEPVEQQDLEVF